MKTLPNSTPAATTQYGVVGPQQQILLHSKTANSYIYFYTSLTNIWTNRLIWNFEHLTLHIHIHTEEAALRWGGRNPPRRMLLVICDEKTVHWNQW